MNVVLLVFLIGSDVTEWKVFDDTEVLDAVESLLFAVGAETPSLAEVSLFSGVVSLLIAAVSLVLSLLKANSALAAK